MDNWVGFMSLPSVLQLYQHDGRTVLNVLPDGVLLGLKTHNHVGRCWFLAYPTGMSVNTTEARKCRLTWGV